MLGLIYKVESHVTRYSHCLHINIYDMILNVTVNLLALVFVFRSNHLFGALLIECSF